MSGLVVALAGGAIGSAMTVASRLTLVPSDVAAHDADIAARDRQLELWTCDEHVRLIVEFEDLATRAKAERWDPTMFALRGAFHVNSAIHRFRDDLTRAESARTEVLRQEFWPHRIWRRVSRSPVPALQSPDEATRLVDRWQCMVPKTATGVRPRFSDPRERSIATFLKHLEASEEGDTWHQI